MYLRRFREPSTSSSANPIINVQKAIVGNNDNSAVNNNSAPGGGWRNKNVRNRMEEKQTKGALSFDISGGEAASMRKQVRVTIPVIV